MTKNETAPRSIEDDWNWCETSINLPEGWAVLEEKPAGKHIWSFLWGGMMLSQENDRLRCIADYHYSPDELRLTLKGWQLDDHGEQETHIDETYRVEFPDPAEMLLYDLEDVQSGEMESLRLTLRRVACCL